MCAAVRDRHGGQDARPLTAIALASLEDSIGVLQPEARCLPVRLVQEQRQRLARHRSSAEETRMPHMACRSPPAPRSLPSPTCGNSTMGGPMAAQARALATPRTSRTSNAPGPVPDPSQLEGMVLKAWWDALQAEDTP
jgi:hypothetical protein